jgi:hypothetical protein
MSAVPDNGQTREYPQTLSHFGEASEGDGEIGPAEDPESTAEERLAAAKAHRTQAETARQKLSAKSWRPPGISTRSWSARESRP